MILTSRDKEIIKFIEDYGSITINQCAKIFFRTNKQAYYQARKRLSLLYKNKFMKRYRADMRSETVYYLEKKLSFHDLKVLDVYAELVNMGAEIKYFKQEFIIPCNSKEYRADALFECVHDGYFYPVAVEVDYSHYTNDKKLKDIYNSRYFQERYKDYDNDLFPTVYILRPSDTNIDNNYQFDVIYSNFNFINKIKQIFN